jgi:tripartite-type tricarboxylate transporter receptor subunit TctC
MPSADCTRRRVIAVCLAAFAALVLPRDGHAQAYPDRAINYIVPSSPGSSPDIVGRIMAEALAKILGQPVVVMNRAGAGGTIAAAAAAKAIPDGYTILQANTNHSFSQTFYKNLGYDLEKDFSPVGRFASAFYIVLAHPKLGVKTLKALIEKAKSAPGTLNYASGGVGAATFIVTEVLKAQAGIDMVHVPYNGGGPALASILAGVTEVYGSPYTTAKAVCRRGKARRARGDVGRTDPLPSGHADRCRNAAGLRGDDVVWAGSSNRHSECGSRQTAIGRDAGRRHGGNEKAS